MEHISRHPKHSHWNTLGQCGESVLATDTEIDRRMEQGSNRQPLWLLDHLFYPIDFSYPTSTPLLTTSAHTLPVVSNISYLSVLTHLHTTVLKVLSTEYKSIYIRASQYAFLPFYATKSHALRLEQVRAAVAAPPTSLQICICHVCLRSDLSARHHRTLSFWYHFIPINNASFRESSSLTAIHHSSLSSISHQGPARPLCCTCLVHTVHSSDFLTVKSHILSLTGLRLFSLHHRLLLWAAHLLRRLHLRCFPVPAERTQK